MTEICRPFASGSRTAPDPQDSYLESKGFYRKHTARDGSSLFRVVSEQVFDIQLYHEMVREDCIGYIERHRRDFERDMDKNYFYYLSILRKPRTSGTLLELRALAHCYKRNVLLFQQFNVGVWFVNESNYAEKEPLRVFISQDRHFDSVFTKDFVELAAKCQALVYELLYINVFRLPDVEYAVERMLYDQDEQKTKPLLDDETKYQTMTGKVCKFDDHTTTDCVLDNDKLCHFHNRENFQELVDTYTTSQAIYNKKLSTKREKQLDSFLYESDKSCVRQLLMENITPFPYKVAKALDWSIYRNIEFDLWSEDRKEMRLKWIEANNADYQKQGFVEGCSDYQSMKIFGTKANHYHKRYFKGSLLDEKSGSCVSGQGFVSREQYDEMSDEQKKKYVLLNDHSDICKVGTGLTGLHNFQPCLQEMIVMPAGLNHNQNGQRGGFGHKQRRGRGGQINNHQNHQIAYSNVPAHNMNNQSEEKQECIEYNHNNSNEVQYMPYYTAAHPGSYYEQQPYMAVQYDSAVPMPPIPAQYQVAPQAAWSQGYYNGQPATLPTSNSMPQPLMPQYAVYPPTGGYTYFTHDQRFRTDPQFQPVSYTTLQPYSSISAGQVMPVAGSNVFPDSLNLINSKDLVANINYSVKESIDTNGKDLNVNDLQTLQFFFNLGLKYFRCHQQVNHLEQPQIEINQENHAQQPQQQHQQMQLVSVSEQRPTSKGNNDPDNRAIGNTPTTTKGFAFGHGGNSNRHNGPGNTNGNSNYRKPFTNNRVYQNKRNDVKFNPNVKNVHKNNNNNHLTTNGQINGSAPQSSTVPMHSPILPATENPIVGDNNIAQNQMYPVYTTQFLQCYSNDPNEAAGGVMHQQFVIPYAPPPINQPIMTQTDPGSADPMQYSNNFTSYIYAPAFVPPTTPISTAGVQQPNYLYYSPMHTLPSPTPQPVVSVSSTNTSSTNTFNSSGSM